MTPDAWVWLESHNPPVLDAMCAVCPAEETSIFEERPCPKMGIIRAGRVSKGAAIL